MIAVDVGHGQMSDRIKDDAGVISVEGFNVRDMTPESLAAASGTELAPSLVTGDLSFISLGLVLPAVQIRLRVRMPLRACCGRRGTRASARMA